ncbi:MAG: hypothetical protein HY840_09350 [Bacteroidetes bacterium]|nr:hypothetical protein [Bacteroidota bacterium]
MKHNIIIVFILSIFSFETLAQNVPGYQGKVMAIGYTSSLSIPTFNVNSGGKVSSTTSFITGGRHQSSLFALNITHAVTFNYVYKRNASFVGSINYAKSACWVDGTSISVYDPYNAYGYNYIEVPSSIVPLSCVGFTAGMKKYKNELAPIGSYLGYKFGINFWSGQAPFIAQNGKLGENKFSKKNIRFIYAVGRQVVIADKFLFDTSLDWDILSSLSSFIPDRGRRGRDNYSDEYSSHNNNVVYTLNTRTLRRDAIEFRISIGYLF